ncbi:preprotein translocase subunit YajC [Desulfuribacillus stibiiarsenatis]|uniref:Preprotein translocase subunit YajC n=1 Tax=Desulfuribacillus stibiiarsenatis TaxID=1390249 RepID=A0A1E5L3P5_9FIRM|nr:preprotein translocase subunit YajC [Desulfuribacillus stibiiarsenatis]OEH84559.1 preprotein translocase subunit YajC [Desulfuribacillus stibiiarsenatis]
MDQIVGFLPLIIMFAIFYFLLIRPQQKRQKERNVMLDNLKKGDKVVTLGGLHGVIAELNDDSMVVKAGETKLTFERSAVSYVKNEE